MAKDFNFNNKPIDKPQEACGVFGIVAPEKQAAPIAYYGIFALQHRGQESAGIATFDFGHFNIYKNMGFINQVFNYEILSTLPGQIAIAHTRYSTMGESDLNNAQPFSIETRIGTLAFAYNGNIINALELKNKLLKDGRNLYTTSDSEIITNLIAENIDKGSTLEEALMISLSKCIGAFSLLIATKDKLIAARDSYGLRPLSIGITFDGDIVIASETCSLDLVGARFYRDVAPGEILIIDLNKDIKSYNFGVNSVKQLCIFEIIYFARPDSILYESSVNNYRFKLGIELAKNYPVEGDIIIPVPDSGTSAAIGYSFASKIPLAKGLFKNRNIGRTFIQPIPEVRQLDIKLKLNPIRDVLANRRVIVVDDSIVRGTTGKNVVEILRQAGAKEVHLRISSAPIKYPCFYGIDTDSSAQLIASKRNIKSICEYLSADTLKYLSIDSMYKTCSTKIENDFCLGCFTGVYPIKTLNHSCVNKMILKEACVE